MPRRRRSNPWVATGEVFLWVLFALLLVPAGFAGWAVGHYTSLGGSKTAAPATVTVTGQGSTQTVTVTTPGATTGAATTGAATTSAGTTTSAAAGNAAQGKAVFASAGCAACHTFAPAGASGTVGPDLDTAPTQDAQKAGMQLAAFVKESIVQPDAYVPSGYAKGVMPTSFGSQLTTQQLDDLVAFIVSGAK